MNTHRRIEVSTALTLELVEACRLGFVLLRDGAGCLAVCPRRSVLTQEEVVAGDYRMALVADSTDELRAAVDSFTAAEPMLQAAAAAMADGQARRALALAQKAHGSQPNLLAVLGASAPRSEHSLPLHLARGLLLLAAGDTETAVRCFERAHEIDPRDTAAELVLLHAAVFGARSLHARLGRARATAWLDAVLARVAVRRCEVVRNDTAPHVLWQHPDVLRRVHGVLQVGAHEGGELPAFCRLGIPHQAYFEPEPGAFAVLQRAAAACDARRFAVRTFPLALADRKEHRRFWIGSSTCNSSFLPLSENRSALHAANVHARAIDVETATLDGLADEGRITPRDYNLLFLDVQGTEHEVLLGARSVLAHVDVLCLEVSYAEVYAGAWPRDRMVALVRELGFRLHDELATPGSEQGDLLFVR